jgi:hypothetical protein
LNDVEDADEGEEVRFVDDLVADEGDGGCDEVRRVPVTAQIVYS